ncbi:urea ABC transporter permease subunit UrtC [Candidatus Haliotispira prima]|uniref:Urea ABC transporter permease subunit UrtC n=1 Tax=Candidatus Haliotispira prima TaxID=3034016 RepID=A0ABY8MJE5_9SPIO|nr:urea ABC transporter permease subunit UrtC [Candidatus Haliotispira prima]
MKLIHPFLEKTKGKRLTILVFLILLLFTFILSDFRLNLMGKYVSFAIVAVGLNLLWGYTGILSLGHGVFFSLGAYSMAMHLKLREEALPDFMAWSGLDSLPWFWEPFQYLGFALPMAIIIPMILALLIGLPTFKSEIKGVYFSILSQALALAISIFFIGQQPYTGGTNGITNLKTLMGISLYSTGMIKGLYLTTVLVLFLVFLFSRYLVSTRTGRVLKGIRDGENRLKYLGYNPVEYKVMIFCISAGIAGLAGALFVTQVGIISPSMMGILPSVEMAIWVAVGGRGTIIGPIIGAVVVNYTKSFFSETFPDMWLYFFGALFISIVLFLPKGLMGLISLPESMKKIVDRNKISIFRNFRKPDKAILKGEKNG